MKKTNEVELFSLDMMEGSIRSLEQLDEFIKTVKGVVAVNLDPDYPATHVLFYTPEERNEAYQLAEKLGLKVAIRLENAFVDKKYLSGKQ